MIHAELHPPARRLAANLSVALTLRLRDGAGASRKRPAPGQRSSCSTGPTQPRHCPAASARGTGPHARYLGQEGGEEEEAYESIET